MSRDCRWGSIAAQILAVAGTVLIAIAANAQASSSMTPRLIVKFMATGERAVLSPRARVALLAADTGVPLAHQRSMAFGAEVVTLFRALPVDEAEAIAAKVAMHPDVELVQPDYPRRIPETTHRE